MLTFALLVLVYFPAYAVVSVAAIDPTAVTVALMAFAASVIASGSGIYIAGQARKGDADRIIAASNAAAEKIIAAAVEAAAKVASTPAPVKQSEPVAVVAQEPVPVVAAQTIPVHVEEEPKK